MNYSPWRRPLTRHSTRRSKSKVQSPKSEAPMPPAIIWRGNTGLVPLWSGADLQIADRITDTDVYRGPFWLCRWSALLRGTYGTGLRLGWVVTNSKVQSERKGIGLLTITWEPGGPWGNQRYLPLDDFRCESVELYPKVERNKNMRDPATGSAIDPIVIALCYDAVHGDAVKKTSARNAVYNLHARTSTPPAHSSWAEQEDYGIVLLDWLDHGNETYYEAGIKYSYIR